jgi:valyl-tRNA synthetase
VSVDKKLSNEKFVNSAPANVLEIERKKKSDTLIKIEQLKQLLGK